jgi:aspartokinase/homoserine dehydrogenase 1
MNKITLKFGGSSLNNPDNINRVCQIIINKASNNDCYVVVSALKGTTEKLISICQKAKSSPDTAYQQLLELVAEHHTLANKILDREKVKAWQQEIGIYVEACLQRINKSTQTEADIASILSLGEKLSAALISQTLHQAGKNSNWLCSESLIKTTGSYLNAQVDNLATEQCFAGLNKDYPRLKITIITGFCASNHKGQTTLLGRNASDYSAAIVAKFTGCESVELFGDTAGILSADPDYVPGANSITKLSFSDAIQLAKSGSGVLHPRTIEPLIGTNINLRLSDIHEHGNTLICSNIKQRVQSFIATWSPVANPKLSKTPDLPVQLKRWQNNQPQASLISVFLADHLDVKACLNTQLQLAKNAGINVLQYKHFIHQKNLAFSIHRQDLERFTRLAHSALHPLHQETAVAIIGASGKVGRKTLQLLLSESKNLYAENGTQLRIVAICNSKNILWCKRRETNAEDLLQRLSDQPVLNHSAESLLKELSGQCFDKLVVVDASASSDIAALYERFLAKGIAIVTPNKLANSAGIERFANLKQLANKQLTPYLYETTVAAALPIIKPLLDLRRAGDKPIRIEAVLSGTIAYVLDRIQQNIPFTQAIEEAVNQGYAEPDPLQDLSGEDVARKILILLRTCGIEVERAQIKLIPLQIGDTSGLLPNNVNQLWQERVSLAQSTAKRLCYVASFINQTVTVNLKEVDAHSAFYRLRGTENALIYQSEIYNDTPLTITGPGAGIGVTSAGVFTDVVAAAESLSRRASISSLAA